MVAGSIPVDFLSSVKARSHGAVGSMEILYTLPETAPENRPGPNRKGSYSNHPF